MFVSMFKWGDHDSYHCAYLPGHVPRSRSPIMNGCQGFVSSAAIVYSLVYKCRLEAAVVCLNA